MKKKIYLPILLLTLAILNLAAYQNSSLSLMTPTALGDMEGDLTLSHRFLGPVDKDVVDSFFGLNSGANVGLFMRKHLKYGVEAKLGFIREKKEYQFGLSYKPTPEDFILQAQADYQYFSYNEPSQTDRRKNGMLLISFQNKPTTDIPYLRYLERLTLNGNVGYDAYYQRLFIGMGLSGRITDKISLITEYYPVIDRSSADYDVRQYLLDYDAYTVGVKLDTYGHQFMFQLSNADAMDARHMSMGTANSKDIKFGFNIMRKF